MAIAGPMDVWRLWRDVTAADTDFADTAPSRLAAPRQEHAGVVTVRDLEEIMFRAYGVGADNDTFVMRIYAAMDQGPLQKVLDLSCILGTQNFAEGLLPQGSVQPSGVTWRETDTYTENDDLVGGAAPTASTGLITSFYRFPTLGFKHFFPKVLTFGGTSRVALLWKPVLPLR